MRSALLLAAAAASLLLAAPLAQGRALSHGRAMAAAETRAGAGQIVSECSRVHRTRMDCWLMSFDMAEVVDGETGEATPVPVEIYIRVFYRRSRLFTWMPLTDERAIAVRRLVPRRAWLRMEKAMPRD